MTLIEHYLEYVTRPHKEEFIAVYRKARETAEEAEKFIALNGVSMDEVVSLYGELFDYGSAMLGWNEMDTGEYKMHMKTMRVLMALMVK